MKRVYTPPTAHTTDLLAALIICASPAPGLIYTGGGGDPATGHAPTRRR